MAANEFYKTDGLLFIAATLAAFSFFTSIASGAILVSKGQVFPLWLLIHRIFPFLTIAASFLSVLFLLKNKISMTHSTA
jgi:hypothetical protein